MIAVGDSVGAYEVVAKLRSGGMAELFLGKRRGTAGFERPVAIKVLHASLATDATLRTMLVDEARMAVQVRHPNVVQIEDLGEHRGQPFLVMEYVHGVSLAQLMEALANVGRRMSPSFAAHVGLHAAAGLHAAHEACAPDGRPLELVHRDISPQNVLLSRDGHVKVIDFGIAKARDRAVVSFLGMVKGKYGYMAPEQARGEAVDRRTDVFALGVVLWEMLTGRRLFYSKSEIEQLLLVREPVQRSPRDLVGDCPEALDALVMRALAQAPADRPATAHELRRGLVAAVPDAAALDPTAVSALLSAVTADALEAALASMPDAVAAVLRDGGLPAGAAAFAADALTVTERG